MWRRTAEHRLGTACGAALAWLLLMAGAARAGDWKVVESQSWLGFACTAAGVPFDGRFAKWTARITFDPARAESGHAVVTVDMASAVTGDEEKDRALPQAVWFDAKAYPQATFTAQSFRAKGGHDYDAIGTLTLRDVTKPVVMPVTIEVDGKTLEARGRLELKRTDFGIGASTGAQWIALEVVAAFDLTAVAVP